MIKNFLFFMLLSIPCLGYSQSNVYSSSAENSQNDLSFSHVIGDVLNMSSENGEISSGILSSYTISPVVTGEDLMGIELLSVYPNPTKDILVLRIGELGGAIYTLSNSEGVILQKCDLILNETKIDFSSYQAGVYYLNIIQNGSVIKSFSVLKK